MSDRISITYDANIDDLRRKLDDLIAKNKELSAYATAAAKALSNIASAQGLSSVNNINNSFNTTVNVLAQVNNNLTQVNATINNTTNTVNRFDNSIRNSNNSITRMGSQVDSAKGSVSGFEGVLSRVASRMAAYFAIDSIINFGKSLIQLEREFEMIQNRMNFVFTTSDQGELAFNRLRNLSMRLGLDVKETANAFSTFGIASKAAGFSSEQTEQIFTKVAVSLKGAGANSLQTSRAFYALQQMLSKGVVSAEELRRQLGESLPGASDYMAEAFQNLHPELNVTNESFIKLLENGEILSAEVLPEFANVLEETFSPAVEDKAKSLDSAITRLSNGFDNLKLSILNAKTTTSAIDSIGAALDGLGVIIRSNMPWYEKMFFTSPFAISTDMAEKKVDELRKKELENQKMDDFAQRMRMKGIKEEANEMVRLYGLKKAITIQTEATKQTEKKSTKDLTEEEKKLHDARVDNARLLLAELKQIRALSTKRSGDAAAGAGKNAEKARKAEIAAAKELLAAEETRLEKITEGTTTRTWASTYYDQLIKVIEARKNLARVELKDTPQAMGLSLAKLDKDLKKAQKMISSFDPNAEEITIEPEVSMEPLEKLDKEIKQIRQDELEWAVYNAKVLVQKSEEGTAQRLNAEKLLAIETAALEAFNVKTSSDSQKLKAKKIEEINARLTNRLGELDEKQVDSVEDTNKKIVDIIQRANDLIEKTELDSYSRRRATLKQQFEKMARDIKEAMSKTGDFDTLAKLTKALSGVEEAGKKAISNLDLNQVGDTINEVGSLYSAVANYQSTILQNEADLLKRQLDQKLISEEEYNMKSLQLEKKKFEHDKQVATLEATINAASGIVKAIAQQRYWQAALITATAAIQIAAIQAQQFPGFKEGVIDLKGPGTETSDSIPARLSRGESVMTARETKEYKPVLQAIRDNNFEEFISKRYINAMNGQDKALRTGDSFAENITNSFDIQTAELAHLLKQNRKVAIKNVDELARAMRKESTSAKVINRRRFK
jgi:tape measure domain-containing protein